MRASGEGQSATAEDFELVNNGTLQIAKGLTSGHIDLSILVDEELEPDEYFEVELISTNFGSDIISHGLSTITVHDASRSIASSSELTSLSTDALAKITSKTSSLLYGDYQGAAGSDLSLSAADVLSLANELVPSLQIIFDVIISVISDEVDAAVDSNSDYADFAQQLMTINAAAKLIDPSNYIGSFLASDGPLVGDDDLYIGDNDLASLTVAIASDFATLKSYAVETVGDVFGTDTSANFAGASVNMLTDGDDTETLSNASEIVPTFDGSDTIYAGGGNDKIIGGRNVDTFYGQEGNDHLYGFRGDDLLNGGNQDDKIFGGLGDDTIYGGSGSDWLAGESGDDVIYTGSGDDNINGIFGGRAMIRLR